MRAQDDLARAQRDPGWWIQEHADDAVLAIWHLAALSRRVRDPHYVAPVPNARDLLAAARIILPHAHTCTVLPESTSLRSDCERMGLPVTP